MPPVFDVTSTKLAVIRFHGRNHETWDIKGAPPNLRFRYDYRDEELAEWVPRIKEMERSAKNVHALMNTTTPTIRQERQQLEKLLEACKNEDMREKPGWFSLIARAALPQGLLHSGIRIGLD